MGGRLLVRRERARRRLEDALPNLGSRARGACSLLPLLREERECTSEVNGTYMSRVI
jgi:hypothetical protein